jgi:hypothetical protein
VRIARAEVNQSLLCTSLLNNRFADHRQLPDGRRPEPNPFSCSSFQAPLVGRRRSGRCAKRLIRLAQGTFWTCGRRLIRSNSTRHARSLSQEQFKMQGVCNQDFGDCCSNELLTELNRVAEALWFIPLVAIHGFLNASVPTFHPQKQYPA